MKVSKESLRLTRLSLISEVKNPTMYVILLCVFFVIQFCFHGISSYLETVSQRMNVFELYIFFMASRTSQILYLLGQILLSCGVLFFHTGAAYHLIRTNRKRWMTSQILYLLAITIGYNIFIFLSLVLSLDGQVTFGNEWSRAMMTAAQFSLEKIGGRSISIVIPGLMQTSPMQAVLTTFVLSITVGLLVGLIMISATSSNKTPVGFATITVFWFVDILIENIPLIYDLTYISPFGLARIYRLSLTGYGPGFQYAIFILLVMVMCMIIVLYRSIRKLDFVKLE